MEINGIDYEFINELYHKSSGRYYVSCHKNGKYTRIPRTNRVYMINTNKEVKKGYVIHHIDGNKINDNFDNLQLLSRGEHNKIHSIDINHYMFRKGHTYRTHPKSEEHKRKIKEAHIRRSEKIKDILLEKSIIAIQENNNISCRELLRKINRKSHKVFRRMFGTTFKEFKRDVIGGYYD